MMKLKIKSILKSAHLGVDSFDEQQVIRRAGNTLCIKEISKNQCEFICLHPRLQQLFTFKPSTNRKGIYTAQKVDDQVELAHYSLKGVRKALGLSIESPFFLQAQKMQLLVDEYDNNLIYGGAKSKQSACVFLCDMGKNKLLAVGFMSSYEDIKIDFRENITLSVSAYNGNHNVLRSLRYTSNQWEVNQEAYKRIQGATVIQHQLLPCNRILFVTKYSLYHFQGSDLFQTIQMSGNQKIREILKINRGMLIVSQDNKIQVLIEDNDEVTLLSKGYLSLTLDADQYIERIFLSHSSQQVLISTQKNSLYSWKCEHLQQDSDHSDFAFSKVQSSCSNSKEGSISISTGRKYCMLGGQTNVTLWNIEKNQFVLSSQFVNSQEQQQKTIRCCALSPDGNSFMLAFDDKIRVYKILLTKFKYYAQFAIKKCHNIIFSHGGQLVACRFGQGINACIKIINIMRLVEVGSLRVQAEPKQMVWNQLDDQILVNTQNSSMQVFSVAQSSRTATLKFESKIKNIRIDYKTRRIMVSLENKICLISNNTIVQQFQPPFEDFDYIFPLYNIYFIATKKGELHWSQSYRFQQFKSFSLFTQSPFTMICRGGYLVAYSSFKEVMILQCLRQNYNKNKATVDQIVMVERDQIIQYYEKVKLLQANYDMLQAATQAKLQEQKNNYQKAIRTFKRDFSNQIKQLHNNFSNMTGHKVKQERQTERVFQNLETGQIKNVDQLEKMYERKCKILQQKLLQLQTQKLEQKYNYEGLLKELEGKYHRDINGIRSRYDQQMKEECNRAEELKKNVLEGKKNLEFKLFELQEENQVTLQGMQNSKEVVIDSLKRNIHNLQTQLEGVQVLKTTITGQNELLMQENQQKQKAFDILSHRYDESLNRIKLLELEVKNKTEVLEEKNTCITELNHQVGGLEKAKYVLSFRTNQIRKELQPKQELVDRLKNELLKVDEEYKQSKRKIFDLTQKVQKYHKKCQIMKKEYQETKQLLKFKEIKYSDLTKKITHIVKQVDEKNWSQHLKKLQEKCSESTKNKEQMQKKKKDPNEEINRHLMHVEMSLQQVSVSNQKILRGKEKDIARRMKQNSQLMYEVNVKKKNELILKKINEQLIEENSILKKDVDQNFDSKRNSTRAQTSHTNTRRGAASRDALYTRQKSMLIDRQSSREKQEKEFKRDRSRIGSANKTLMYRDETRQKNTKFFHMARQLQSARNTIKVQEEMLQELNKQIFAGEDLPN